MNMTGAEESRTLPIFQHEHPIFIMEREEQEVSERRGDATHWKLSLEEDPQKEHMLGY